MSLSPGESILVVDDDHVFRKRLVKAFCDRGYLAGQAATIAEAQSVAAQLKPRFAVVDLRLGLESGMVLIKQLLQRDRNIQVVVLTGYGTIVTAVEAIKAGVVNYLSKPVDADGIIAAFAPQGEKQALCPKAPNLAQVEWDHIHRVVQSCSGNISQASKILGLHRRSLQRKLAKRPQKLR